VYRGSSLGPHQWVSLAGVVVPVRHRSSPGYPVDAGLLCGRGYAPMLADRGEYLQPRAVVCHNNRIVLMGVIVNREGVAWHKGDTVCMLKDPYRPAARSVFSVPGQHNQVCCVVHCNPL
jgi:hypothetical protein